MLNVKSTLGLKTKIAAIAAVLMTSLPAHAISINPGDIVSRAFDMFPGDPVSEFDFEPSVPLQVTIITTSGTGVANGDLDLVRFGIGEATTGFASITESMGAASAEGELPSFFAGEPFTLNFASDGTVEDVVLTFTLITEEVPAITPVPLPASGLMLGGLLLLGAGGAAARRYFK